MVQWPPSPSVEDEATALSHEHSLNASVQSVKSDDQPALSRGSVDQYPIIIDSPEISTSETANAEKMIRKDQFSADMSSSDDSAGPPTPPPVQRKQEIKSSQASPKKQAKPPSPDHAYPPKVTIERHLSNRGRPKVYRIQTDVGDDVQAMATSDRRKPSPYVLNRSSTFHASNSEHSKAADTLLTPSHIVASPGVVDRPQRPGRESFSKGSDPPAQPSHGSKTPIAQPRRSFTTREDERYIEQDLKPISRPKLEATRRTSSNMSARRSFHDSEHRLSPVVQQSSPLHSRKESKESVFESSSDDKPARYYVTRSRNSSMRDPRDTRELRDSLRMSLTDESSREQRRQAERSAADEQKKTRRRSSHRKERPMMLNLDRGTRTGSGPASAVDGYESRHYTYEPRDQGQRHLLTPTSDVNRLAVEDYFANAFKANDRKHASRGHSPRSSGSLLCSPFASPPHTPRSERHSREYFESTQGAQRYSHQPRTPSAEENVSKDPKVHTTLLSVATTGAAHAARASEQLTEFSSGNSVNGTTSVPRSRRTSPVQEESHGPARSTLLRPSDAIPIHQGSLMPAYAGRPISRGSVNGVDNSQPHPQTHPQVYRHFSYSGTEHPQPWSVSGPTNIVSSVSNTAAPSQVASNLAPQSRSARNSVMNVDLTPPPIGTNWGLPVCPWPHPVVGHQEWYSIRGLPEIDICPSCMKIVGNTRYNNHFVRNSPRPYHEATLCAMNKPWVRIAFAQCMRQNQPDLNSIKDIVVPYKGIKCPGTGKDIRTWYQAFDFKTKEYIPDFYVCNACVRVIDRIFPCAEKVFGRPVNSLSQERSCDLHVNGKHFQPIIEQLDQVAQRCGDSKARPNEAEPLIRVLRRAARYPPCTRDELQTSKAWHCHPHLPEFTVCEECYEEVVWPLSENPIAGDITKTLKQIPTQRGSNNITGISCQLYSDRMRRIFRDTITYRDFGLLKEAVKTRVAAQQRLTEMNRMYEQDLRIGIDRRQEIERNQQIWQSLE